jgi:hypothetical protein
MTEIPLYHFLLSPILWLGFLILRTIFILLGYIMVPMAVLLDAYEMRESKIYKGRVIRAFTWKIMWPWGNEEEGIGWYGTGSISKKILYSECFRNPANNLRYVPILSLKIVPEKVKFKGYPIYKDIRDYDLDSKDFIYFAWHGVYSTLRIQRKMLGKRRRFWIGWKLYPEDIYGVTDHRSASAGFATQLKVIEK